MLLHFKGSDVSAKHRREFVSVRYGRDDLHLDQKEGVGIVFNVNV